MPRPYGKGLYGRHLYSAGTYLVTHAMGQDEILAFVLGQVTRTTYATEALTVEALTGSSVVSSVYALAEATIEGYASSGRTMTWTSVPAEIEVTAEGATWVVRTSMVLGLSEVEAYALARFLWQPEGPTGVVWGPMYPEGVQWGDQAPVDVAWGQEETPNQVWTERFPETTGWN